MRIDEIINELQDIVTEAKNMPLTGKAMIDRDEVLSLIDSLQDAMPREFDQARSIVSDRQQILDDAKRESEAIIKVAEERRRALIDQQEIVKLAKKKAKEVLEEAVQQAKDLKKATHTYVDDILRRTDDAMNENLVELRKVRQNIKAAAQKNS